MITGIIITVVGGILLLLINHYKNKITNKPLINIEYKVNSQSSQGASNPKLLLFKWRRGFKFKNISNHNANNLHIIWSSNLNHINLALEEHCFLKAYDEIEKEFTIEKEISYDDLRGHERNRFEHFKPKELKKIAFILSYENDYGRKFYIRYKKDGDQTYIDHKPKIFKPKFKNEFSV